MDDETLAVLIFVGFAVILVVLLIACKKPSEEDKRERLAELPDEINKAFRRAVRQTKACLDVCRALALEDEIRREAGIKPRSSRDKVSKACLLSNAKEKGLKELGECQRLGDEGLLLSMDGQYIKASGVFKCAVSKCQNCKPEAGLDVCPAYEMIKGISLE